MKVKVTSPCMAMLIYEASRSNGLVEGFLCGDLSKETSQQITDSNVTTTTEDIVSVHCIKPACDDTLLMKLLKNEANSKDMKPKLVGRFKFCRRPVLSLTVREKSNHRKLVKCSGNCDHIATILMQEAWVEMQSTYAWRCVAFIEQNRQFKPIPVEIVNLKATTCGTYKPYPSIHQEERLPQVNQALSTLEASCSFSTNSTMNMLHIVDATRKMSSDIIKSLDVAVDSLRDTENVLQKAFTEKMRLKQRLLELQRKEATSKSEPTEQRKEEFQDEETDSSDSEGSYGSEKTNELLQNFQSTTKPSLVTENNSNPENKVTEVEARPAAQQTKSHDPFVSLVDLAKADLVKKEVSTSEPTVNSVQQRSAATQAKEEGTVRKYS